MGLMEYSFFGTWAAAAGEENETTIHCKIATRVLCILGEQDSQTISQVERQQPAQNPPGYALSNHHHSMAPTTGPSIAFNLDGHEPPVIGQWRLPWSPESKSKDIVSCFPPAREIILIHTIIHT